jgi:hypothetical protein
MSQAAADGQLDSLQRGARLPKHLIEETARLRSSWARHSPEMLRNYLVAGVQDPRTNLQSVLLRHFLIEGLWAITAPRCAMQRSDLPRC